jgi:hypothetical protein
MIRVDLRLPAGNGRAVLHQCLLPDTWAVLGKFIDIELGGEVRHVEIYNIHQALEKFKDNNGILIPDN